MGKTEKRAECVMRLLEAKGRLTVSEAVEALEISEATVRRLFALLEQEGKGVRSYGGIQLPQGLDGYSFDRYEKMQETEKRCIGVRAADLVESGDSVYLDCGTTILRMAEELKRRIATGALTSLNIVTNSIANVNVLAHVPGSRVILLGGEYNHERRDFSGFITEHCLEIFHFKRCFLGSEGFTVEAGFSTNHLGLSSLCGKVIEKSDFAAVLMDKSKFGKAALVSYAKPADVSAIVTDALPEEALAEELARLGVEIVLAGGKAPDSQSERKGFA